MSSETKFIIQATIVVLVLGLGLPWAMNAYRAYLTFVFG